MRKTSLLNRLLSLALCLCMVLSLLPASSLTAFAADSVSYIDRSWNGSEVTSTTKSVTDYTTVESSTTTMSSGWYVVKGNTTVQERITVTGDAHLILCDGASLVTIFGISVNSGNSLTVYGQENDSGSLAATGGSAYAGIGGDDTHGAGTITINGGTVSVNGSTYAACIGSAEFGIGGTVVINGGTVNANGHAGIGAGLNGTLDKIMINGGAVTASGSRGAGIGGVGANTLSNNGYTATIEINGGTVNATGVYGAGIGGGNLSGGTTDISITGGTVIAVCNEWGAGIGGGYGGTGTYNISITGGTVTARGQGSSAYGIGGGFGSEGTANVSISGGSINATSVQSTALSLVTVAVKGEGLEGKQVTSLTLSDGSSYGLNGVIVQDTDKVYLCLANGVTVTAIEIDYVNYLFAGENIFCNHPGYENATCISAGTCTGCGASNNIKDPNNHASTELKYTVNAADSTKHDAAYVCCGAVDRTESHTYESGVCKYCQMFCNHPTIGTDGICTICKQSGYKYLDRSWDNSNKTVISEIKTFIPDVMVSSSDTEWRSGWYAVAGNVTISSRITVTGDVKLVLLDGCTLNASNGVTVNEGNSLTIYGQTAGTGELLADTDPGSTNAGIGGGYNETGGVINIHGGVVNARAQGAGAGIGGGSRGAGGTITIYGGTVCATSGSTGYGGGAGIGGGYFGAGGKITIYGGMITATTTSTDDVSGAGIGSGFYDDGEMISIHGGTVNATSQGRGAGIGGGHVGAGGMVVITGGNVKAVSSKGPTVGGCKGGTLTDGNGNSVSEVVIALESAAADTAVTEVFGVTYGINDVITLDTNKLYLYLPSGSAPTYFTVGDTIYCSASGNNNYSSTTHSPGKDYTADGDVHYSNCTICGSICNKDVHSGGTPDCLNTGNCAVCGAVYLSIDPNTHATEDTYIEYINDNYHGLYHACCKAQKKQIAHTPAEGQEATCVGVATCAECGIAYGGNDTTNHASGETKYISNGNGTHILTHACCGNPAAEPESHKVTYTVNGEFTIDAVCKDCGATGSATFAPTAGGTYNGCVFASSYSATGILNGWNAFTNPVITGCCEGGCKNAGEHTVTMTLGDQSVSATFTVARKTLTISKVEAHYKSYDGTSDLNIYSVSLDGVVVYDEGDYDGEWDDVRDDVKLVYDDLVYTLEDVVPGYYDTVNVSGVTITGSDASNYGIAESFEDVPLLDSMGYDFKIHNATVLIDVHDQLLTGDQEIDQNGYSIDGLEEQFTIEGISLYDNGYSQIAIDPYGISIYLDGEDVTDHFDINIYPGNLSRVCEGHEYDANGFCATGECRSYEPAVRMDEVDEWGSEVTYYDIYNAGQLYWFAEQVNTYGNNYINGRLMTDITVNEDLTAENLRQWTPIGKDWPTYCGMFEGNDYTISGLYVCDPEMDYVGLFGGTDYANSISNIHLTNSYFEGNSYIGGLFGYAGSNISGCTVSDSVTVKGNSYLGGIAGGTSYGELNNSWSAATVAANENGYSYGGLVGNNSLSINNCYTTESSLVGFNYASYGGSLNNSYYLSEEETEDGGKTAAQFASGEVAYLLQSGVQSEDIYDDEGSFVETVTPEIWGQTIGTEEIPTLGGETVYRNQTGGCTESSFTHAYSNTQQTAVTSHSLVNCVCTVCGAKEHQESAGYENGFCENGCYEPAVLNGEWYEISNAGQLYWFAHQVNSGNGNINGKLMADIVVNENVLAADGSLNEGDFRPWNMMGDSNRYLSGTFDGQGHTVSGLYCDHSLETEYITPAFITYVVGGTVRNVGLVDSYIRSSWNYAGGVVGGTHKATVENCWNEATVIAANGAGGIVGCAGTDTTVGNCYNTGTIISNERKAAGILVVAGSGITLKNCYNTGTVQGPEGSDPIANGDLTLENSYYLAESETDSHDGTTFKTAEAFASGEVAYLLQANQQSHIWGQTCGTGLPAFGCSVVYQVLKCDGKTITYSNSSASPQAHTYGSDNLCTFCGAVSPDAVAMVSKNGVVTGAYTTLNDAIQAAKDCTAVDEAVITLLKDIALGENYQEITSGVFTIDLNGKTLSSTKATYGALYLNGRGVNVTVTDSGTGGTISSDDFGVYALYSSTVTVRGGTISSDLCGVYAYGSAVTISGGTISGEHGIGCYYSTVTISGGTISGGTYGVIANDNSTVTISGGSISGGTYDIYNSKSTITLTVGEDGVGATFPGGITVYGTTLYESLGEGAAYWQGNTMIIPADNATEITGGDVVIKSICPHTASKSNYTDLKDGVSHTCICSGCNNTVTGGHSYTNGLCVCGAAHSDAVASVSKNGIVTGAYTTLNDAIQAVTNCTADDKAVVTILKDIALGDNYQEITSGVFTIDLNGFEISSAKFAYGALYITGSATNVTIQGTGENSKVTGGYTGIEVYGSATLTVISGTISGVSYGVHAIDNSDITIRGGTVSGDVYGVYADESTVTISGGSITGSECGVYAYSNSTVTISGGSITGSECGVETNDSTVTISGGTITSSDRGVHARFNSTVTISGGTISGDWYGVYAYSNSTVTISDGTISSRNYGMYAYSNITVTISGGTISSDWYGMDAEESTVTINGGSISGGTYDIYNSESTITLSVGEDGVGATFPGGITVYRITLNEILGEGVAYWQSDKQMTVADDATEITGGDVTIKTVCDHSGNSNTDDGDCTTDVICSVCGQVAIPGNAEHSWQDADCTTPKTCTVCGTTEGEALGHKDEDNSGRCDSCDILMQPALLRMVSISLKGNIALNYYMLLSDEVLSDSAAYMQFTMADGEIVKIPVSQGVQTVRSGETYYVFSCAVDAKEMTDDVISQFFYDGGSTKEHTYSVQTYAKHILENSDNEDMKALVKAMLHYGAASQIHFGYNTDNLANAGLEAPDYSDVTISGFNATPSQGTELAKFYSASLILKSETTLRFFFTAPITAAYNGQELEVKQRSGLYYVDVVGIAAKDLDENVTITINDGTNTADVTYNPMAYCAAVLNDSTGAFDQEMKDVVSALYLYNQAANIYFKEN